MYYIYGVDGRIYHGEDILLKHKSTKSKIDSIKSGDTIRMFIDRYKNQIHWFVNGKYAGT